MAFQNKVTGGQRQQMIADAAYFRAERRGFVGGDAVRDWCEAEAEVDAQLHQIEYELLIAKIEEVAATAGRLLASVRRRVARLSVDARSGWQDDLDKLAALRDALRPKLAELKEQGERAGQKVREQVEKIRDEITALVKRLEAKAKH